MLSFFPIMHKIIDLFFDYPMIVIYSSGKNVSGTYHVRGSMLRETAMNKIDLSSYEAWISAGRQRVHTKEQWSRARGLDPDGEFDSHGMPGTGFLISWHWSRVLNGVQAGLGEDPRREDVDKAVRQEQEADEWKRLEQSAWSDKR